MSSLQRSFSRREKPTTKNIRKLLGDDASEVPDELSVLQETPWQPKTTFNSPGSLNEIKVVSRRQLVTAECVGTFA